VIYINAVGISSGGGLKLLEFLLTQLDSNKKYHIFFDSRLSEFSFEHSNLTSEMVIGKVCNRFKFERSLSKRIRSEDTLFCFNNLPPLFKNKGRTIVYLQNRQIVEPFIQEGLSFRGRVRLILNWLILNWGSRHVNEFYVQTPTMKRLLGVKRNVTIIPFLPKMPYLRHTKERPSAGESFIFFYPSEGHPHKNHERLVKAWALMKEKGETPILKLTLNQGELPQNVESEIRNKSLNIKYLGNLEYNEVFEEYLSSDALIFPSLCESFGLPLLEAQHIGCPIIASDLSYVKDVVKSVAFFNPLDSRSISTEVVRFMSTGQKIVPKINFIPENIMKAL